MSRAAVSVLSGLLFGLGLVIGGMTQPAKVVGFLDFTGNWDPSLAMVMIGAIAIYAPLSWLAARRPRPVLAESYSLPARREIDWRLIGGAALFGIGWGIGGFCPGPAVASLATGHPPVLVFVLAMAAGMYLYKLFEKQTAVTGLAGRSRPGAAVAAAAQGPDC